VAQRRQAKILGVLASSQLRERVSLPWDRIREEFVSLFLAKDSYAEFISEVGQFVATAKKRWLSTTMDWPQELAESEARDLLERTVGIHEAMRAVRHGDHGGMRGILDVLCKQLQAEALEQYLQTQVLPEIHRLSAEESIRLAEAYLQQFKGLGVEVEHPAVIAARWPEVLRQHARLVVFGT